MRSEYWSEEEVVVVGVVVVGGVEDEFAKEREGVRREMW